MKSWKVLLGVGGACVACCALPIAGWFAGLGALAAGGLALSVDTVFVAVAMLAVLALGALGLWSRQRAAQRSAATCGCGGGCA
jgi:hypothetical protein